jgi:hypothetical protein
MQGHRCSQESLPLRRVSSTFMNDIVVDHPDTAIHVILDTPDTDKPKNDRRLKRHPNVQFHLTPIRSRSGFRFWKENPYTVHPAHPKPLRERIDALIESYNQQGKPFVWIKVEVHRSTYQPTVSPGIIFSKRPAMKPSAP